jgi:hypothetical protein
VKASFTVVLTLLIETVAMAPGMSAAEENFATSRGDHERGDFMSWIDRLAPFRKGGSAVAEAIREESVNGAAKDSPPLICLVNDASGRASFKTHVFADAESATDFVQYWFPNQSEGGMIAFWAMTYEPLDPSLDAPAEPLVMIRDLGRDGVVYLFSFSDVESAQAFLRDEVQHGTDLGSMMLYWAVTVRMAADPWGKMMLTPAVPPGAEQLVELEAPASDIWTLPSTPPVLEDDQQEPAEDSRTIFQEAPNAYTGVAEPESAADDTFQLTAWMERARKKPAADSEALTSVTAPSPRVSAKARVPRARARLDLPPVVEELLWPEQPSRDQEPAVTPAPIVEETPLPAPESHASTESTLVEDLPKPSQTNEAPQTPTIGDSASAPDRAKEDIAEETVVFDSVADEAAPVAPVVEEAAQPADEQPEAPEEATMAGGEAEIDLSTVRVHVNGNGHLSDAEKHDDGYITINPAEIVVHEKGHSTSKPAEIDFDAAPQTTTEAETNDTLNGNSDGDHGVDIRIDIRLESSRAMNIKRWKVKEGPFDGFNSPPGRF